MEALLFLYDELRVAEREVREAAERAAAGDAARDAAGGDAGDAGDGDADGDAGDAGGDAASEEASKKTLPQWKQAVRNRAHKVRTQWKAFVSLECVTALAA